MAQLQFGPAVLMIGGQQVKVTDFAASVSSALDRAPPTTVPETLSWTGELIMSPQDRAAFNAWAKAQQAAELKRLKALAAMSGLPVVYDTTAFGMAWSPVYEAAGPVGWSCNTTGAYRAGEDYPGDDL